MNDLSGARSSLRRLPVAFAAALLLTSVAGAGAANVRAVNGGACARPYSVTIHPSDFETDAGQPNAIDNALFPLVPGTTFVYEGAKEGTPMRDVMVVTNQIRTIMGVPARVIHDSVYVNGVLEEDTFDWYAQNDAGDIWYFGEDTRELDEAGNVVTTEGSWEAGVGDNLPGLFMAAAPRSGTTFRQEFAPDVAVDMATILSRHQHVNVPLGSFRNGLETKDSSCMENGIDHKFYVRGIGLVAELAVANGREFIRLVRVTP